MKLIQCRRLRKGRGGFTIAIDDGFCAYKAFLPGINKKHSIESLIVLINEIGRKEISQMGKQIRNREMIEYEASTK